MKTFLSADCLEMSVPSSSRGIKRKHDEFEAPNCRFGKDCYRRNIDHFQECLHSEGSVHKSADECNKLFRGKELNNKSDSKELPSSFRENQNSNPYSFYFNKVEGIEDCFNENCLSIKDILSDRFGKLIKSIQFNYLVDIPWLMKQYPPHHRSKPLLIVHGFKDSQKVGLQEEAAQFENVRLCKADLTIPFGTHHTKMMIHLYEEGVRIIISTANLIENDWTKKTQSIWVSPMFPKLSSDSKKTDDETRETNFDKDLVNYLSSYRKSQIDEWIGIINDHDLSTARVHLVASVPGRFSMKGCVGFGHLKLKQLLEKECDGVSADSSWPVICQASSIGSLGSQPNAWLTSEFLDSLSARTGGRAKATPSDLKIVYPSVENIRRSLEGYMAGGSFPYSHKVASKQTYLKDFLLQWRFDTRGRDRAMPHLKSYFRPSPDNKGLAWYLMTSANMSKAAWGCLEKNKTQFLVRSYEIGVLFVPRCFNDLGTSKNVLNDFSVSLDLPVTPYSKEDEPWIYDISYTKRADTHGRIWKMN